MAGTLEKNIASVARIVETTIADERWAQSDGWLQSIDARIKILFLVPVIILCALTKSIPLLIILYLIALALAWISQVNPIDFIKRVWIFIPLFTGFIAIPALFITPGRTIVSLGPLGITREGLTTAVLLTTRVAASISFAMLLILTTRWNAVTRALGYFRVPGVIVTLLSISYRYSILLMRILGELLTARIARVFSRLPYRLECAFLSRSAGMLFVRSLHIAEGVQMAMESRSIGCGNTAGDTLSSTHDKPAGCTREAASDTTAVSMQGDASAEIPLEMPQTLNSTISGRGSDGAHGIVPLRNGASYAGATDAASPGPDGPGAPHEDHNGDHTVFSLRNVYYTYPDGTPGVRIDGLDILSGACTIILGPNGSGKSTLLKILDGLIFPQGGEVRAFGEIVIESRLNDRTFRRYFRSRIGLVFQNPDIQNFSPTVRDELAFGPMQKGLRGEELDAVVQRTMELLGIGSLGERYPYRLSGGEKKRVSIASVLTVDPEVYLLDEPTASLDPATEGILIDLLAGLTEQRKTLVIATQDLLLARHIGEHIVVLDGNGAVAATGEAAEVLENQELLMETGLVHAHRAPHRTAAARFRHSHYIEKSDDE